MGSEKSKQIAEPENGRGDLQGINRPTKALLDRKGKQEHTRGKNKLDDSLKRKFGKARLFELVHVSPCLLIDTYMFWLLLYFFLSSWFQSMTHSFPTSAIYNVIMNMSCQIYLLAQAIEVELNRMKNLFFF